MSASPDSTTTEPNRPPSSSGNGGLSATADYLLRNKTDALLILTRGATIIFTFLYLIPIFGSISQLSCYQKALVGNAATSALRLHQRLPSFRINREFMALFLMEDSCHYLMYSIIFLFNYPITLVLFPICLFAILHLSSYILVLLDKSGSRQGKFGLMLSSFVENYQRSILQMVALTEIILMPITIFALFGGVGSLFTPFIYYRFLSLRYGSRRNPYTRNMFHELRLQTQALIFKPACPAFIRNFIVKMIDLISKLAPPMSPTSS